MSSHFFSKIRGFTLIELLVVISIIGLLSSVVLAALSGARAAAVIGASLTFDDHMYHAYGATAVGVWNFDEGNGVSTIDLSGNNNTGTLSGSGVSWTTGVTGRALNFSGGNVTMAPSPSLNTIGNSFTISAWINTTNNASRQTIYSSGYNTGGGGEFNFGTRVVGNGLEVYLPGVYVAWIDGSIFNSNTWTYVVYTRNGPGTDTFYVNGKINTSDFGSLSTSFNANTNGATKYIGQRADGNLPFSGMIDDLRIYPSALTYGEVQRIYAAEAPKYGIVINYK